MKCHERWIDILESIRDAYPALQDQANRLIDACKSRVEDNLLHFEVIEHAFNELFVASNDPFFGWHAGWHLTLRSQLHRSVTVYLDLQPTLGDSLMASLRYPELIIAPGFQYQPETNHEHVLLHLIADFSKPTTRQLALFSMAAIMKRTRDMVREFDCLEIVYGTETDPELFKKYTNARLTYSPGVFSLRAEIGVLMHPQPTADAALAEVIRPVLDKEVSKLRQKKDTLIERLEKAIRQAEQPQIYALKDFANSVGMSEASIRRKLADENVSFTELVQNYIRIACIQLLMDESETVDTIGLRLGFSERAAFDRAFKRWYGLSPAQFREHFYSISELEDARNADLSETELSPLPKVVKMVLEYVDMPDCSVEGVARIIKTDLIFSARILSAANSAFFGAGKVRDLEDAINRVLGIGRVRNMALAMAMKDVFNTIDPRFDIAGLWFTALMAEQFLEKLRRKIKWNHELAWPDFVSSVQFALVGQLLISQSGLPQTSTWLAYTKDKSLIETIRWEKQHFGMTVFTISSLLLAKWGMNNNICKFLLSISPHIHDAAESMDLPGVIPVILDMMVALYRGNENDVAMTASMARVFGIKQEQIQEALEDIAGKQNELRSLLEQIV